MMSILDTISRREVQTFRSAYLGLHKTVLRTCHEHEALDFEEVGELSGVRLPHADRVGFLVRAGDQRAQVGDQREIVCWA